MQMMNAEQLQLYERIQAFSLDKPCELPFSQRLVKENGWRIDYAQRVIDEYKKFAFLAVVSPQMVTPSEAVDQVWHLHLQYTRSYWEIFCPQVLHMPLHHAPTAGGRYELERYIQCYRQTLADYERFFDAQPPADIWLPPHLRFGADHHVRIDRQQHWIMRKPQFNLGQWQLHRGFAASFIFAFAILLTSCTPISNPLNLPGSEFLTLYLQLSVVSVAVAAWLRSQLKRSPQAVVPPTPSLNPEEMAYLAGGAEQVVNLAIVNLVHEGCAKPDASTRSIQLNTLPSHRATGIDLAVAQLIQQYGKIQKVQEQARQATDIRTSLDQLQTRLQNLGLLMSQQQADRVRWAGLPIWALLLLGLAKIDVGVSRGKPVGFLIVLCVVTGAIGLLFLRTSRRTPEGDRALSHLQRQYDNTPELPISFALLGASVLIGGELEDLRQTLVPPSSISDIGLGGGSSGGSSCGGGGGCGGCGG